MKSSLALLSALFLTAAHAASNEGVSWYAPVQNVTCTGHPDGHISCQAGQVEALLNVGVSTLVPFPPIIGRLDPGLMTLLHSSQPDSGTDTAIDLDVELAAGMKMRSRSARPQDTQPPQDTLLTCKIDGGLMQSPTCFIHCFAQGFCNASCDGGNICQCDCKDGTPAGDTVVCGKTSC